MSVEEARHFLSRYHLQETDVPGVFKRLGSVQYDPLNPVGRNPDLVLQARVPDYHVDDWQKYAYEDRGAYDAWDKQACLVPTSQWTMRAPIRSQYQAWHDRDVLDAFPEAAREALSQIDARGPLSSLEFTDRFRVSDGNTWLGPTRIKRILRALWIRGALVTHHRQGGRHYYDRPERVIPAQHFAGTPPTLDEYHRWIVFQRHLAVGLLRRNAEQAIWSACGDAATRLQATADLVDSGSLTPVRIGSGTGIYHTPSTHLYLVREPPAEKKMVFLAPLDNLLWDRRAVHLIFGFQYVWEVYKREQDRRWGYYVLPIFYGDRFVARLDSRLEGTTWMVHRWWWEENERIDNEALSALSVAGARFMRYLRAERIRFASGIEKNAKQALRLGGIEARNGG